MENFFLQKLFGHVFRGRTKTKQARGGSFVRYKSDHVETFLIWASRCFVGTLVLQGFLAKCFRTEIFAKHRRHAACEGQHGEAKIMVSSGIRGLLLEPCSCKVCSGNFSARKFLQSVGATQRFKGNAGEQ